MKNSMMTLCHSLLEYGGICLDRTFFKKYSISVSANRGVDRTFSKKHSISVSANRGANRTFSKKHSISVSTITALFQKSSVQCISVSAITALFQKSSVSQYLSIF